MGAPLITTTLLLALGQTPASPNQPVRPGLPLPPAQREAAEPQLSSQSGPASSSDAALTPVPAAQTQSRLSANDLQNNGYAGYRLTPNYGEGASYGSSTYEYAYPNFDAYEPWVHGYWQDLPAYGGFASYRPYNYRHVYVQSEVAGIWGTSTVMPNSHEYFRKPREQGLFEQRTSARGQTKQNLSARQQPPKLLPRDEGGVTRTAGVSPGRTEEVQQIQPQRRRLFGRSSD